MNSLTIAGNVGRVSDLRTVDTQFGERHVIDFSVAVNDTRRKDAPAQWFKVVVWGNRAENLIAKHVKKGDGVIVTGQVDIETWRDRDGNFRADLTVQMDNFQFAPSRSRAEQTEDDEALADEPVLDDEDDDIF